MMIDLGKVVTGFLLVLSLTSPLPAVTPCTIYFYNTETSINNFGSLKGELDTYLSKFGAYEFQPFSDRQNFEQFLTTRSRGVLLISSWHYSQLQDKLPLEPILVGTVQDRSTQKRALYAEKSITSLTALKNQKLASAGSEEYTRVILTQILGVERKDIIESVEILQVPKDIDGLMAIGFGAVKFALTTESNFQNLAFVSPKEHDILHALGTSEEVLLPIVAAMKPIDNNVTKLLEIVEKMGDKISGKRRLSMINLESMKKFGDFEKRLLER